MKAAEAAAPHGGLAPRTSYLGPVVRALLPQPYTVFRDSMTCPKCGFQQPGGASECARCGIIFSRLHDGGETDPEFRAAVAAAAVEDDGEEPQSDGRMGPREWRILGFGFITALVAWAVPLVRFLLSTLVTLFHELGHAVVGWLLGCPSLPAFDLVYGGGFTHQGAFHPSIAVVIAAAFGWLGWQLRRNPASLVLVATVFLIWLLFVSAEWRRELAIAAAGHAFEFILAGVFFYRALADVGWQSPELERPLAAFVAFFVQINCMAFAWRLLHDPSFMAWYREGKGGALMNDLEVVALDVQIYTGHNPGIPGVTRALLWFAFVPVTVALISYLWRGRLQGWMRARLTT